MLSPVKNVLHQCAVADPSALRVLKILIVMIVCGYALGGGVGSSGVWSRYCSVSAENEGVGVQSYRGAMGSLKSGSSYSSGASTKNCEGAGAAGVQLGPASKHRGPTGTRGA